MSPSASEPQPSGDEQPDREPMTVFLVDDQRAFVESIAIVIDAQPDLECVGVATCAGDAVAAAARLRPDVVVMDLILPDFDGIEATSKIIQDNADAKVLILTGRPDATALARAATAGATAFMMKSSSIEEILDAVRQPPTRRLQIDPDALSSLLEDHSAPAGVAELTQRELEVLGQLAEGHQPKQIARHLGITLTTCRGYIKAIFQKLGAHSALEAVILAHRFGVINLDEPTD
jgi:SARP family transcriptional regulator, regulator of embCAB operon